MLKVLKSVSEIQKYRYGLFESSIGFVPTMGSLHEGHFELIRQAKKNNKVTIVSIFVNPTQFNNRNDFETYPDHLETDLEALRNLEVDAVITPQESDIYPNGYHFKLTENKDSIDLCGSTRPGHFDGVLTVLIKLFNLIKPSDVYMGLKDFQQYKLVKNMATDLFLDIQIHGVPTVREKSGLALSSRNLNLKPEHRIIADEYARVFSQDKPLEEIRADLEKLDLKIDYLVEKWGRKFVAVFIGDVRLIDNRPLNSVEENIESLPHDSHSSKKILFKMTGSIACYKACDVISKLVQKGYAVKIAATPDVFNFVGRSTLEGLTGSPVYEDMHKTGDVMEHIHLNDWCDLVVLCPATANTLAKIAVGLSDNMVTSLALSKDNHKPYLIFPAMNTRMFHAYPMQENFEKLKQMGHTIICGNSGHLACGHVGEGRLAEPSAILESIEKEFGFIENNKSKRKILVTAGGTSEPIDPVRFITNTSTGETGLKICESLQKDYDVYILAASSMKHRVKDFSSLQHVEYFKSFRDLETKLKNTLSTNEFEAIVHLAAVSDYSPSMMHFKDRSIELPTNEKISSKEEFTVEFKKNKKLIEEIKDFSLNKNIKIVGFKLLRTDDQTKIQNEIEKILKSSDCVVVNSLENISDKKHFYEIYNLSGLIFHGTSKIDMAQDISKILNNEVSL